MWERVYPEIGKVLYVSNKRSRRIILRIRNNGEIRVTIPLFSNITTAEKFVLSRKDWIFKTKEKVALKIQKQPIVSNQMNITNQHSLEFVTSQHIKKMKGKIVNNIITVSLPLHVEKTEEFVQTFVSKMVEQALSIEAKQIIPERLGKLAAQHSFSFTTLKITKAKTRWGSCSGRNSINISCYIMRLPEHLIDFIILHELCHTVQKNHGPRFHKLLETCTGEQKKLHEKELKKFHIS